MLVPSVSGIPTSIHKFKKPAAASTSLSSCTASPCAVLRHSLSLLSKSVRYCAGTRDCHTSALRTDFRRLGATPCVSRCSTVSFCRTSLACRNSSADCCKYDTGQVGDCSCTGSICSCGRICSWTVCSCDSHCRR